MQPKTDDTNPKDLIGTTKPPLSLVPSALKLHVAEAMKNGADKYGPYNWRTKKVRATIYIDAAMRHLEAYNDGENKAEDSGVHHLAHAAACLGILLDAEETGNLIDDRPTAGAAARVIKKFTKQKINPEEGGPCPTPGCVGRLQMTRDGQCSCHVHPPCHACENSYLICPACSWEGERK